MSLRQTSAELPTWAELHNLPSLCSSQCLDLRIDTGDFRIWTSRMSLADGEPYARTVYAEFYEPDARNFGWHDLGHYDGDKPPRSLPGMSPHALRGEF